MSDPFAYNGGTMLTIRRRKISTETSPLNWMELVSACAQDRDETALWSEFLRRYGPKIKQFIRGTLAISQGRTISAGSGFTDEAQVGDLFQSTIIRLVEKDCAAMKRFSGSTEEAWLAYLAVISRSVVRSWLRRRFSQKRYEAAGTAGLWRRTQERPGVWEGPGSLMSAEKELLAREIQRLCERSIENLAGESAARDKLIFQLYFLDDLTTRQIAECRGVNLSKAGVEKVLNRLKERMRRVVTVDASEAIMP